MTRQTERSSGRSRRCHHPYQKASTNERSSISGLLMDGAHPHLWLTKENIDMSFRELVDTIQCRRSITELSIYHIHSKFTKQEFAHLYDTIARLPKLQKFSLWTLQPLDLPVLTNFLEKAQKLREVTFQSVDLQSWKSMSYFANALLRHPSLTNVCLDQVRITAPGLTLDPLLHAIARNPTITSLKIATEDDEGRDMILHEECLVRLCTSNNLRELSLSGVELDDAVVLNLARALQGRSHLQTLSLRHCSLTQKGQEALVNMLQNNSTIQTLYLGDRLPHELRWWMDFYLYINKTHTRDTLLENATHPSDWLKALAPHSHDVSAAFHLLKEHGLQLFHS